METDKKEFDDQGWRIFEITTPAGVTFKLAFRDDTLRIRREGWVPVEVDSIRNTCTEVNIRIDVAHNQFLDGKEEAKGGACLDDILDSLSYSAEEGFCEK